MYRKIVAATISCVLLSVLIAGAVDTEPAKPGEKDKCPVCGMHLELVQDDAAAGHTGQDAGTMTNGNVPGLVALTIEPKRLQLIGIRTGTVENRTVTGGLRLTGYVTPDEEKLATMSGVLPAWYATVSRASWAASPFAVYQFTSLTPLVLPTRTDEIVTSAAPVPAAIVMSVLPAEAWL